MKFFKINNKSIITFLGCLIFALGNAQTSVYKPFPSNYGNWIYQYIDDFGMPPFFYKQYRLNGDTTLGSTSYKKIYDGMSYSGGIREDNKIIYFVPDTASSEYVLYNFNLSVGDTVFNPFNGSILNNDTAIVTQIDSVLATDGWHKQFHFSTWSTWIEGIGSTFFLLSPFQMFPLSGNYHLVCSVNDSSFIYPNTISSCALSVNDDFEKNIPSVVIYPNPSSKVFNLFCNCDYETIIITNILGQTILEKVSKTNKEQITLDAPEGIYFLSLKTKNSILTKRIEIIAD